MKSSINKIKIDLMINYMIVVFTIIATIIMFFGISFMYETMPMLESSTFGVFKYFTVDANLLMGIVAFIFAHEEKKLLTGQIKTISSKYYVLKLVGTSAVTLTFIVVFAYLGRISKYGYMGMLTNSNLFFHLIIPVLSILSFTIFERTNKIKFRYVLFSIIPVVLYGIYYIINILTHVVDGQVSYKYDLYWFVQDGLNKAYIVAPCIILIAYVISIILYILNRERDNFS